MKNVFVWRSFICGSNSAEVVPKVHNSIQTEMDVHALFSPRSFSWRTNAAYNVLVIHGLTLKKLNVSA